MSGPGTRITQIGYLPTEKCLPDVMHTRSTGLLISDSVEKRVENITYVYLVVRTMFTKFGFIITDNKRTKYA
ncbi:unnamed protein product [marine sediment metagenome]|uniref:Uncharacterized protein n=1 Tax=marine sediment metagenome TaxID=412755 RepID=X1HFH7_9ZZZZ